MSDYKYQAFNVLNSEEFTVSLLVITSFANAQQIAIIPEPYQMKLGNGSYTLPKALVINAPASANTISDLISKKINAAIFKAATGKKMGSISPQAFVDEIQTISEIYEAYTNASSVDFESKNGELFSVTVNGSDYFYGAAHPSGSSQSLVFDLSTGEIVTLKELFEVNFEKKLAKIAERNFIRENGKDGWDFTPGDGSFPLPDHFIVGPKGLNFTFGQYEIGPYAAGMPTFFVPFEQLKELIPTTSRLHKFL